MGFKVYLNGRFVDKDKAKISIFDHGLLYGDGVFEGIRSYRRCVFKLKEHTNRLFRSARMVGIKIPLSKTEFNDAVKMVVRVNNFRNAHIKPVVSRGTAWKLGLDPRNTTLRSRRGNRGNAGVAIRANPDLRGATSAFAWCSGPQTAGRPRAGGSCAPAAPKRSPKRPRDVAPLLRQHGEAEL